MHPHSTTISRCSLRRCLCIAVALVLAGGLPGSFQGGFSSLLARELPVQPELQRLQQRILESQRTFSKDLEALAQFCDDREMKLEAGEIRRLATPLDPNVIHGADLPRHVQLEFPITLPPDELRWRTELRHRQSDYAQQVYQFAQAAFNLEEINLAYQLIREVVRHAPDHSAARSLLGYVRYGDEWVTPYAAKMLKAKYVFSDKYGWLRNDYLPRYENGERYYNRRWMSALKEAELRRDFNKAWVVETEHYQIRTNHSLEMGVELGRQLEDFYHIFFQTFAGFLSSKKELQQLFDGKGAMSSRSQKFKIYYFRTRDEYNDRLRKKVAQDISITTGLYVSNEQIAYFFHDDNELPEERFSTMFHEATHQLFTEAYAGNRLPVGLKSDFWIIEGIACYMQSFQRRGDRFYLGQPDYIRFQNARYRLVEDRYYVPLAKLTSMGMTEFQEDPNLAMNYSQSSGVVHFLMHYQQGQYREALVRYLAGVYHQARPENLEVLTGTRFAELDQQYMAYIAKLEPIPPQE